jgi:glycosyltransferase involved in cell wall biosynthesis
MCALRDKYGANAMEKPRITVVLPTYKRPQLLKRAIQSVLNQSYQNFRVCVYDDASNDETCRIVSELSANDPRITYYCHTKNIGTFANTNFGLEKVDTPYFSILTDDDFLFPEFFETALEGFERHPDAMACDSIALDYDGKHVISSKPRLPNGSERFYPPPSLLERIFEGTNWIATLFRSEVLNLVGLLDLETREPSDIDYFLRISGRCPRVMSKKVTAVAYLHPDQVSAKVEHNEDYYQAWKKIFDRVTTDMTVPAHIRVQAEHLLKHLVASLMVSSTLFLIKDKEYAAANNRIKLIKETKILTHYRGLRLCAFILVLKSMRHSPLMSTYLTRVILPFANIQKTANRIMNRKTLIYWEKRIKAYIELLESS